MFYATCCGDIRDRQDRQVPVKKRDDIVADGRDFPTSARVTGGETPAGHVVLPVGVNPNTQIMGSNCEGSERAKLLCRLSGSGAAGCVQKERERERREGGAAPRFHPFLPFPRLSFPTFPSRRRFAGVEKRTKRGS